MAGFKFGFTLNSSELQLKKPEARSSEESFAAPKRKAEEVIPQWDQVTCDKSNTISLDCGLMIKYREQELESKHTEYGQSDLIANVYEGGHKIWECSLDLTNYLSSLDIAFRGLNVLEIGCGVGIPGIYCLTQGATVDFQDYNIEVLTETTIQNVKLNSDKSYLLKSCRFFAGDWQNVSRVFDEKGQTLCYDIILTSETIYNEDNQLQLYNLIKQSLKTDGTVYIAAKTHYFGVGGSTQKFVDLVESFGVFVVVQCRLFEGGLQREILQMKFK